MTDKEMAKAYAKNFAEEYREVAYDAFLCGYDAKCSSEIPNDLEEAAGSKLDDFDAVAYMGNMEEGQSPLYDMQQMLAMFIAGAKWDRERMMEEAVEITLDFTHQITLPFDGPGFGKKGDKVRVIICKKEDKK